MENIETENATLRAEVANFRAENSTFRSENAALNAKIDSLTALVKSMEAARNNPPPPPQTTAASEGVIRPFATRVGTASGPNSTFRPWVPPIHFASEGYQAAEVRPPTPVYTTAPPLVTPVVVNAGPHAEEVIYHHDSAAPSENGDVFDRLDGFQDQFQEMKKELKALRGKDLFGRDVNEMCLVPNVKVPLKFKVPEFEKFKGNTCPQTHLIMYVRKMSMHTEDQRLLIHCFQDSLTGPALRWYMGLDSSTIKTFHDLGEAFVKHYKYNVDMAPDRDQLRAMSQKDKESFKEYAQRWRELAAQITPPMEDKEMTKIFLKTLDSFFYERMVASAPSDFTEMVGMGMRLEEAVREGRLIKEAAGTSKRSSVGFPAKKREDSSALSHRRKKNMSRGRRETPHQIATVTPVKLLSLSSSINHNNSNISNSPISRGVTVIGISRREHSIPFRCLMPSFIRH